ncbi:Synaptic vesicle transporter SVOP and related transporters (major facilitator superfamily) [Ceraceosorus bombacis]|uniref:Synaptic vesicle transporter SVOP and related transporters (Major facilitator superfamily) n=1 Tax=Ceraceosorus bombacis TaxID=401625 RepID=A0A0P1BKH8_9BASI|nr:Synaptic vesicle transporter SVOP and related transporters (major facilitator superfamily) [Ceraceosorus bombacis]
MVLQSFIQYKAFSQSADVQRLSTRSVKQPNGPSRAASTLVEQDVATGGKRTTDSAAVGAVAGKEQLEDSRSRGVGDTAAEEIDEERVAAKEKFGSDGKDEFLVDWDGSRDPLNPQNWSWFKKWSIVLLVSQIAIIVGVAAGIDSAAAQEAAARFQVSEEVMELQTAIFLVGFGVAAPFLGPLSEIGGRLPVYVITLGAFCLFEVGSALAPNIQTRVILRFFAGFFGSTPLSNAGGSLADIVGPTERTFVFPVFAAAGFLGPSLGPAIGGYLGYKVGQEWCDWLMAIWGGAAVILVALFMPETFAPSLLRMKALQIRKATGDERYTTALERARKDTPFIQHLRHAFAMPFKLLFLEPIVFFVALYMTVVYIVLFGAFEAYPLIFEPFDLNPGEIGLTFIAIAIGIGIAATPTPLVYKRYLRVQASLRQSSLERATNKDEEAKSGTLKVPPEERLILAMCLSWLVPVGLFWQAWTAYASIGPWPCIVAGLVWGIGVLSIFISSYQYVIDVYNVWSASALGSLTFLRYIISGGAIMWTRPLFMSIGTHWALSFYGFLSIVMTIIPFAFYVYGKRIRSWSRYALSPV